MDAPAITPAYRLSESELAATWDVFVRSTTRYGAAAELDITVDALEERLAAFLKLVDVAGKPDQMRAAHLAGTWSPTVARATARARAVEIVRERAESADPLERAIASGEAGFDQGSGKDKRTVRHGKVYPTPAEAWAAVEQYRYQTEAARQLGISHGGIQSLLKRHMRAEGIRGPLPGYMPPGVRAKPGPKVEAKPAESKPPKRQKGPAASTKAGRQTSAEALAETDALLADGGHIVPAPLRAQFGLPPIGEPAPVPADDSAEVVAGAPTESVAERVAAILNEPIHAPMRNAIARWIANRPAVLRDPPPEGLSVVPLLEWLYERREPWTPRQRRHWLAAFTALIDLLFPVDDREAA